MLKKFARLWKDKRGNAILIAGAALPVLVGSAGLATDTIQWALWKRELQRAADSAAFAGTYASASGNSVSNAVSVDLSRNNHVGIPLQSGYPQIAFPAANANYTNAVQVTLAVKKDLTFSGFFMETQPTIVTSATAGLIDIGEYCVRALRKDTTPGIVISGNTTTNLGCRAQSNSRSSTTSVNPNGSSYVFNATAVAGVGGLPSSITGTPKLIPHSMELADPFANKYPTSIPAGTQCKNFNQMNDPALTTSTGTGPNKVTTSVMNPGCYNGFAPNGKDVYLLKSGTYYLNSTDFKLAGQDTIGVYTVPGEANPGVTIILTGTTPGSLSISGTTTVNLFAPTSGTYAGMLFIQAPGATTDNNNTLNGTASTTYNGAVYFPNGQITMNGTAGNQTRCLMIVGYTVKFAGNANVQNDKTGCKNPPLQTGKAIRLLA